MPHYVVNHVGRLLLSDIQQLATCINEMVPDARNSDVISIMEGIIASFEGDDGDQLCRDIYADSASLGNYCRALKCRLDGISREQIQYLYDESLKIEKNVSMWHKNLRERYKHLYKWWKAEREGISRLLSSLDGIESQNYKKRGNARIYWFLWWLKNSSYF